MALSLVGYGSNPNAPADDPIDEPITLAEAKQQIRRTDVDDEDEFIDNLLIPSVRERAEGETGRQLISAIWDYWLDRWPCVDDLSVAEQYAYPQGVIKVPLPPLQSVVYIKYVDMDGATQTWSSALYQVDAPTGPRAPKARIIPAYGEIWPTTRVQMNAVQVRFVAGYGDLASDIPPQLKRALLFDLGTVYENREDFVVGQGYAISQFPLDAGSVYRKFKSW